MRGSIMVIGLGPGSLDWLAPAAEKALGEAEVILGYHKYLRQIETIGPGIPRQGSGMRHEVERARQAIDLAAQGKRVAVVSGGDAGVYGMAGLALELLAARPALAIRVEVLPGISALNAAAALLGAPLMTDFAAISLSVYLIPLDTILSRLKAAIQGDFVICLYNPRSRQRTQPYDLAYQLLLEGCGPQRPVGLVQAAYREDQQVHCVTLQDLPAFEIGMDWIMIVGNRATRIWEGKMITARGYPIEAGTGGE